MLPVGNRPIIDYVVEDCIRAGITEFLFVVGEEFGQIKKYYGHNQLLEEYLEDKGKLKELEEVQALNKKARFHYVVQDQYQPYGTATPVWLCRHLIKPDEKVLVVFGDQFFYREDGTSELSDFLQQANEAGTPSAMMVNEVSWDDVSHYGVVVTRDKDGKELYERIVEKPTREEAPSNLNNSSCFLIDPAVFPFVEDNLDSSPQGEHLFIDAVNAYAAAGNDLAVIRAKGAYMDCGTTNGWLHANQHIITSPASGL